MTGLTTLQDVWNHVEEQSNECWDCAIPVSDLHFNSLESLRIGNFDHPVKPVAQWELSARLGIPLQYVRKCPVDLQAANLNYWLEQAKNEELFMRFKGNDIRAVFTTRYIPVDHKEILKKLDAMGFDPETKVQCHLDENFLTLNIPDENRVFELKRDDRMQPGISFANSEVGLSSLSVSAFVLRLVCTNGLITTTDISASYRHISNRIIEELPEVIRNLSRDLDWQRNQWEISLNSPVPCAESTFKAFNRQFNLRENEQEAVTWAWPMEQGNTMFNIVNTYTKAAQYQPLPAESAFRLQKTAGNILALLN